MRNLHRYVDNIVESHQWITSKYMYIHSVFIRMFRNYFVYLNLRFLNYYSFIGKNHLSTKMYNVYKRLKSDKMIKKCWYTLKKFKYSITIFSHRDILFTNSSLWKILIKKIKFFRFSRKAISEGDMLLNR